MKTKITAVLLSILMISSCFVGCKNNELEKPSLDSNPIESISFKHGIYVASFETDEVSKNNSWYRFIYSKKTYRDIKKQGFDHVRLPVNFHKYYSDGKISEKFLKDLDGIIETILREGLTVVLDFHG